MLFLKLVFKVCQSHILIIRRSVRIEAMTSLTQTIKSALESKKSLKIAFIGDSITSAEWVHPNWREILEYVFQLELTKLLDDWKLPSWGIRCFNYEFDGSTTTDIRKFVENGTIPTDFDLVIYQLGDNDRFTKLTPAEYLENIKRTLTKFTGQIILCSNPAASNNLANTNYQKTYYPCFTQLSPDSKIISADLFTEFQKLDLTKLYTLININGNDVAGIKPGGIDFLHPNQLGNAFIAKIILEKAFQIPFNPEKYLEDAKNDIMFPTY
ncbi:MAG: hypothetical protein UX80_C0006G0006 [Candidatus Amesbacteria bacterium GW2011_GWA2_47_11b]|uniref:SGNH hydrolase-type esterase domain-containing protein n=3 Tax=Candidatus Amesiibacteriota TaxID=1752730 RepID=A0A0G1SF82_9BACT|nr:MAG: hypothetical protein UX42_C0003G0003 [Microgenomates group bacterium GW2011_GWC1_46_20]KKU58036.1 MAG: hypothetical protein UX80_C0006G0006 [Candidatus Amesbacteria bacterium GW2011_GWA2_47_11b]KKU68076.1 MAG: hypothetical protein UX92_C0024G0011 [Candidatus Amesbacteria bacterium GW2011_GWA1_47_20]KKU84847.1 MAG: hypothetical protein UY11_C0002G0002 [Candidatus Amesbacteria bacterium GW2011_GWC2_47_8]